MYPASEWNSEPTDAVIVCLKDSFTISLKQGKKVGGWKISPTSSLSVSFKFLFVTRMCMMDNVLNLSLQLSKGYLDSIKIYGSKKIPHISLQIAWVRSNELDMCDPVLSYGLTVDGTIKPYECTSLHLKLPFFHQDTGSTGLSIII